MGKISLICGIVFAAGICSVGCGEQKQFAVSLREGLFQGVSVQHSELTICAEFSEMSRMEYVKTNANKVKDLSTVDAEFYTAYHVDLVLSEGNENYVLEFEQLVAQNAKTVDTYQIKELKGDIFRRALNLSDVTLQLIDLDGDRAADELKIDYKRDGASDGAQLKFISAGEENGVAHHHFQYHCNLTYDEDIRFEGIADGRFWAGTALAYLVEPIEGRKVVMYVNDEPYAEIAPGGTDALRFEYVTGYRDVEIRFRSAEIH